MPTVTVTWEAQRLGGLKNLRQCKDLVEWTMERVQEGLVLDVGAHFGAFCVPLLMERPDIRCHAFEPNPEAVKALAGMAEMNGMADRLTIHEVAMADRHTTGILSIPNKAEMSGLATLGHPRRFMAGRQLGVEVTSLDYWADGCDLAELQAIKMDVEGAEYLALLGGERIIRKHHPLLIVECQQRNATQLGVKRGMVERVIEGWGYAYRKDGRDLLCE